ncbi:hypothetical protein [Crenobacter intestini]|uniref:hypothetical protein n=1 Tax=Crenobacter intestini TaxID=2563443 RepID=UPI001F19B384|nr:hypothetical protein [Crenobacter intestini]
MKDISVLVIGAGETGAPLLTQLLDAPFVDVRGVADLNLSRPGIALARARGVAWRSATTSRRWWAGSPTST